MIEEYRRCSNCLDVYLQQVTGPEMDRTSNEYCEVCHNTIKKALEKIPKKFKSVWIKTDELSADELLEIQDKQIAKDKEKHPDRIIFGYRLAGIPLFDMNDYKNYNECYLIKHNNKNYKVSVWSKRKEDNEVFVEMEENLKTGEMKIWEDYK